MTDLNAVRTARTETLEIAYEHHGERDGFPVILLHGFPYDPRAYDGVVAHVTAAGYRAIVPYLRGFGGTRFLSPDTMRSGQQAALGHDLLALLDALDVPRAVLAGYDWGGRAACIVSALWPGRVHGLVTGNGYNIQDIAASGEPAEPEFEHGYWYQYYFNTERGRAGLAANRRALCRLLWRLWSPTWAFDDATFEATAPSFGNPDFVEVVVHSYRHRFGNAEGDPAFAETEKRLAALPPIAVPTIALHGEVNNVAPVASSAGHGRHFTGPYERRTIPDTGHNLPQEAPGQFADAVVELCRT